MEKIHRLLVERAAGLVVFDRPDAYHWVRERSWCWAHLRRDFRAMIDRDDGGSAVGRSPLKLSDDLFWRWHRVADDELRLDDLLG